MEIVKFYKQHHKALLPNKATPDSAGWDLCACLDDPVEIPPGKTKVIPTGLNVSLPHGYEMQIRPRSGLAAKHGITVLNTPGTIDEDYCRINKDEIMIIIHNTGDDVFTINPEMRIAQCVFSKLDPVEVQEISHESLWPSYTMIRQGGLGSTGI